MCIAIYKPAEKDIPYEMLKTSADNNPDGCGLAYINKDGKLTIFKTMKFEDWWVKYQECLEESPDSNFLIHFRVSTHGTVDEFNCHPFVIDEDHVFIHNGTIHKSTPPKWDTEEKRNDTQIFNDTILKHLPEGWMYSAGVQQMIEAYIGEGSKIAVMNSRGEVLICNEDGGYNGRKAHWKDGVWYSNNSYQSKSQAITPNVVWWDRAGVKHGWNDKKRVRWDEATKAWYAAGDDGEFLNPALRKTASAHTTSRLICGWCGLSMLRKEAVVLEITEVRGGRSTTDVDLLCEHCAPTVTRFPSGTGGTHWKKVINLSDAELDALNEAQIRNTTRYGYYY